MLRLDLPLVLHGRNETTFDLPTLTMPNLGRAFPCHQSSMTDTTPLCPPQEIWVTFRMTCSPVVRGLPGASFAL